MRIIDSHHHLWDYDPAQYPWIDPQMMKPLNQSYGLNDLDTHRGGYDVQATIAVQARQSLEETDWLLGLAKSHTLCKGVVGWVPLRDEGIDACLERYADEPLLKGVRHVIQDETDPEFIIRPEFIRGLESLAKTDLRYDILIFGHQLTNTIKMVDRFPEMPFVLDHVAKPVIRSGAFDEQWASGLAELAKRANVCCKLSGMATEVRDPAWDVDTLRPYAEHAIEVFGVDRLMFGSDWPVCLLRSEYGQWVAVLEALIASLSPDEQDAVWYRNAAEFYGIE